MSKKAAIRIAIGSPEAMQSSVWRFWSNKNEVYVAARDIAGFQKISFHSSGIWRLAYVSEKEISDPLITDSDPRVIHRWKRPQEFIKGWTQCLDIVVYPGPDGKKLFNIDNKDRNTGKIIWIDSLPQDFKEQISMLFEKDADKKIEEITPKIKKVWGKLVLSNGVVVWIVSTRTVMSDDEKKDSRFKSNDIKIDYPEQPDEVTSASLIGYDIDKTRPVITSFCLGLDNVYVKGVPYKVK